MPKPTEQTPERLLRLEDLAARWRVSPRSIQRLVKAHRLVAVRIGNQLRLKADEIARFEATNQE
jgi:excisionase family DNA binding protein